MFTILLIITILVSCLLGLAVLVQNPKGGGIQASLGTVSNQILGASRATNFIEKLTWYLAGALVVLSIAMTASVSSPEVYQVEQNKNILLEVPQEEIPVAPAN
ncbi:MAG: preprotein translocase subunit SecG [Saprospirales bacterium TMED214]|nr:MAG: preprotein translocase subunit SecG [Saprospirales bacterium TMED214]